jgi:hypothetical protein
MSAASILLQLAGLPAGGTERRDHQSLIEPLAGDGQSPMPALEAQVPDIRAGGLRNSQPFKASSEISACPPGGPSPAATSSAPSSLRSSAVAWDS